jgi:hypothetical protein
LKASVEEEEQNVRIVWELIYEDRHLTIHDLCKKIVLWKLSLHVLSQHLNM